MTALYPERTVLAELVEQAQAVIRTVAEQAAADRRAFDEGYRLGFAAGVDVGQGRAEQAEEVRARAQVEAIGKYSRTPTYEQLQVLRYPGYSPEQLRVMRGRDRFPMNDRLCIACDGRGYMPGGVA